jgi:hypothetical protein
MFPVLAIASLLFGGGVALAETTTDLIDVSKQVASIQQKIDKIVAAGSSARTGKLLLDAACGQPTLTQRFASWADTADYALMPSGSLETVDGWTFNDKAGVVGDNAPDSDGTHALFLREGGKATTPSMCVTTLDPTIRFFAKHNGDKNSILDVKLLYESLDGKVKSLRIAKLHAQGEWSPTVVIPYYMNAIAAATPGGVTAVAFQFEAHGVKADGAGWTVDDLYVDPFKMT